MQRHRSESQDSAWAGRLNMLQLDSSRLVRHAASGQSRGKGMTAMLLFPCSAALWTRRNLERIRD